MKKGFIILICTLSFILVLASIGFINPSSRNDIFSVSNSIADVLDSISESAQSVFSFFSNKVSSDSIGSEFDLSGYRRIDIYSYTYQGDQFYCAYLRPKYFSGIKRAYACTDPRVGSFKTSGDLLGLILVFYSPNGDALYSELVRKRSGLSFSDVFSSVSVFY